MKKFFITYTTENYKDLTEKLLKSISLFSNYKIICYTINFNWDLDYKNVQMVRYDLNIIVNNGLRKSYYVDRDNENIYKILTLKPKLMKYTLSKNKNYKYIFIDGDIIVNFNIDNIFNYFKNIKNYPLFPNGIWDKMMINNKIDIEKPLMNKLNVKNRYDYVQTNIILFNKNCFNFIDEWININDNITNNYLYYAPLQDETTGNVLLWKYDYINHLPNISVNILNLKTIKFIDNFKENGETYRIYENDIGNGWQLVPYPKKDILFFHGCKNLNECDKVINYLTTKKYYFDTIIKWYKN